ncbi:Gfo/Idh/MocA family protein [Shouchella rhizosphaerae]|uniref:Gfo/Idh/MocA family protein n=1 Tax=Shouchella rhizosphaerae TaxID=866786 RepID=UPI00203E0C8D|nr:Gfo/Idh/MocA family oxidoreductase [Shouchella rhizosphaerae]MCM3378272.1 Gfo/Idh/MocA family oxidoreductase [Shouchella rhizosphaerae]
MTTINWAILGPGAIASDFAQALNNINGTIYAVGSRSIEKAQAFASKFDVKHAFGSYDSLLHDENIDAVYIATPHSNHYEYIKKSLQSGKHVLCEKAITVNGQQLEELMSLAKEKQLVLMEAMTLFHMPLYAKLQQVIRSKTLGLVKMINVTFGSLKEANPQNRFFNKELAGGAILDIGTYALSFARFFLESQPHEVLTTVKPFETGVDEQSGIVLKNKQEQLATIALAMRSKMPKRGIVACEGGYITVDDFPRAQSALLTYPDGSTEEITAGQTEHALQYEIQAMEAAIAGQGDTHIALSRDVMELMDTVRRQWGITYPFE